MQSEVSKTWEMVIARVEGLRPKLLECGVRESHINQRDRSFEDNVKIADMVDAVAWIDESLIPEIKKRDKCYAELTPQTWENLNFIDPDNEHQKTLDRFGKVVKDVWSKRPDVLRKSKKYGRKRNLKSSVSSGSQES